MDMDMKQVRKRNTLRESLLATGYNGEIYGFPFMVTRTMCTVLTPASGIKI